MTSTKMYAFLEQYIVGKAFLLLHKLTHNEVDELSMSCRCEVDVGSM